MNESERSYMLGNMDVKKLLLKLAIPATAAMAFNALYNLVDTFFVARGVGEIAIGALSIAYPIHMIVLAIGIMIGIGSSSVFSRAYGRQDKEAMRRSVNNAIITNLVVAILIGALTLVFMDPLLRVFGATETNIEYARGYLTILVFALVPFSMSVVMNNLIRAEGRPKAAMISLIIGAVVNIILDPIFIFDWGLGLGVAGAAWATLIGKTCSFIYIFYKALQPESALRIHLPTIHKIDFQMIGEIFKVGLPSFVRTAMGGFLIIIVNNLINHYATVNPALYISIYGVINRLIRFTLMPGFGLVQGMVPIVGFNYGAEFFKRLHDVVKHATKLLFIYFFSVFILVFFFAEYLFMLFATDESDFFIREGARAFRIVAAGFAMVAFQVIASSLYQAMGFPSRAFILALSRRFLVFVPAAFILTRLFGVVGIWWTFFVADLITGGIGLAFLLFEFRRLKTKMVLQT